MVTNVDEKIKVILGTLLDQAPEMGRKVLSVYNYSDSFFTHVKALSSSKISLERLEATAAYLGIELADEKSYKLHTKASLSTRIIFGIESLFPAHCVECNSSYTVDRNDTKPVYYCYTCFKGSHWCPALQTKFEKLAELNLPVGMHWLCKDCVISHYQIEQPKRKISHENGSNIVPVNNYDLNTTAVPTSELSEKSEDSSADVSSSDGKKPVCRHFKKGTCVHGLKGNKIVNGIKCKYRHPKRCFKYLNFKDDKKKGCVKGGDCQYYHPPICPDSLQNKVCEDTKCKMPHLKSFRRSKKDRKPRNISSGKKNTSRSSKDGKHGNKSSGENSSKSSKDEDPRNTSSSQKYSSKLAYSKYKASFLEVKELMENIHLSLGKFQEELNQVKTSLRMTPRSLAPVGHQGHYLGHLSQYPDYWPMLSTPPLSC